MTLEAPTPAPTFDLILYREDIEALIEMVENSIRVTDPANFWHMVANGSLHLKLSKMRDEAPSILTKKGAA